MIDHEVYHDMISAYVDGELNDFDREKLMEHVSACGECADLLREYEDISSLFTADAKPSDGFSRRVMRRVRFEKKKRQRAMVRRIVPVAACLVIVACIAAFLPQILSAGKSSELAATESAVLSDAAGISKKYADEKSTAEPAPQSNEPRTMMKTEEAVATEEAGEVEAESVTDTEEAPGAKPLSDYGSYGIVISIGGLKREFLTHVFPEGLAMPEGIENVKFTPQADGSYTAEMPTEWFDQILQFAEDYGTDCAYESYKKADNDAMLVVLEP